MRVYNQAFTHGMMTLMVTTTQGHVYRPDEKATSRLRSGGHSSGNGSPERAL